jgi:nucleoside-diphosphate-sugar epimerase
VAGVDAVVHAAGLAHDVHATTTTDGDHARVNTEGMANAATAVHAAGIPVLVLISSVKAMADRTTSIPLTENEPCRPTTPYGRAKLRGEQLAGDILSGSTSRLVILRLTPVYGPGSKGNLNRLLAASSRRWMPLLPLEAGARSMIHVEDVASLVLAALSAPAAGVFIADDGLHYVAGEIQRRVRSLQGISAPNFHMPATPLRAIHGATRRWSTRSAGLRRLEADLSRILDAGVFDGSHGRADLGWQPQHSLWATLEGTFSGHTIP